MAFIFERYTKGERNILKMRTQCFRCAALILSKETFYKLFTFVRNGLFKRTVRNAPPAHAVLVSRYREEKEEGRARPSADRIGRQLRVFTNSLGR